MTEGDGLVMMEEVVKVGRRRNRGMREARSHSEEEPFKVRGDLGRVIRAIT